MSSPLGRVSISTGVVKQIVARTAAESYGVVALAGRAPLARRRVGALLGGPRSTQGVRVAQREGGLAIDVHVVVAHGLNLAEVGGAVRSRVAYEVDRLTRLPVASIEVHIDDVRASA